MKKIFSYILIITVIFVNLFAPFSVRENGVLSVNKTQAEDNNVPFEIESPSTTSSSITISGALIETGIREGSILFINLYDSNNKEVKQETVSIPEQSQQAGFVFTKTFNDLTPPGSIFSLRFRMNSRESLINGITLKDSSGQAVRASTPEGINNTNSGSVTMPECGITHPLGCIAQGIYYVLFTPTSYFFALAGKLFDISFAYSVQDSSYRSSFVVEGWALVRDMCNIFFIFVLLYAAVGSILDLHINVKDTIRRIIIIGLFINFSLYITQIVVDVSNVTARVFYNANTITITDGTDSDGSSLLNKNNGVISLSEGLIDKVNPQNLIIYSNKATLISKSSGITTTNDSANDYNVDIKTFFIVTLMATAVNVVGFIVFLSVALIFISRVVGIWIAMILSPLAFFSYTVPELSTIKTIGWKNWWSDTLGLAFLAPVFIFFLYIILRFLDLINVFGDASSSEGLNFVISSILPFFFIMILLFKAKNIASDMSGEMGKKITGGVAALGGAALGGAALGGAFLGRRVVGAGISKMSKTEDAVKRGNARIKFNTDLEKWESEKKKNGGVATRPKPKWEDHAIAAGINKTTFNPITLLGSRLNEKQKKVEGIDHARHIVDEAKEKAGFDANTEFRDLSHVQQEKVKDIYVKDNKNKWAQEEEDKFRAGNNSTGKIFTDKEAMSPTEIKELRDSITKRAMHEFEHEMDHASQKVAGFTRAFSKVNTGSWDIRNLSQIKANKREGIMTKIPTAMIAGVALGVRTGLKQSGVNHGTGQSNFMKDLGLTITEALKGMNVAVPKSSGGGSHGGGGHDAHGGGGHGGGGHH